MEKIAQAFFIFLTVSGFIGWLGGGRKWAFRSMVAGLALTGVGVIGVLSYRYWREKVPQHRAEKIHECAIAKIATATCESHLSSAAASLSSRPPKIDPYAEFGGKELPNYKAEEVEFEDCPPYMLFSNNPTPEEENIAMAAAEEKCAGEIDPNRQSLHEQIIQYRREHGTKQTEIPKVPSTYPSNGDIFDQAALEDHSKKRLSSSACAAKVRKKYPGSYDDLDDATLMRKLLAKYPTYCDIPNDVSSFEPIIEGIR